VGVLDAGGRDRVVGDVVLDDLLGAVGLGDVLLPLLLGLALRVAVRLRRRLVATTATAAAAAIAVAVAVAVAVAIAAVRPGLCPGFSGCTGLVGLSGGQTQTCPSSPWRTTFLHIVFGGSGGSYGPWP
jgi:hypothetical protein